MIARGADSQLKQLRGLCGGSWRAAGLEVKLESSLGPIRRIHDMVNKRLAGAVFSRLIAPERSTRKRLWPCRTSGVCLRERYACQLVGRR